ncbi:hypothetical protein MMC29_007831, partial [Sticta canariensis]|nr:hypothetical protein [Sticta canariensis]
MDFASGHHFLPSEIQRNIISWLVLPFLVHLRLASKTLAAIGAEFLLPEVHLLYRTASFERLEEIFRHPLISQHVTTLFYEADRLDGFCHRPAWERPVEGYGLTIATRPPQPHCRPPVWDENHANPCFERLTDDYSEQSERELTWGWTNYVDFCWEQQNIATRNLDHDQIARSILFSPKLLISTLFSDELLQSYSPGIVRSRGEWAFDSGEPAGFRQITSLMLAFCAPKERGPRFPLGICTQQAAPQTLHVGAVSCKRLSGTGPEQALYKTAMARVTDLMLSFILRHTNETFECAQ